ncbi:metallophosphoesterase 1 homolog [Malaya genurostris]|uniref:metallophosphoesterase 1 homolog n=1 Tax=Malaya genurostris TaxID=325434 RepID=UPI0026F3FC4A|nr:metallophosphoesterase 1 homolog [Malaya genurostris]
MFWLRNIKIHLFWKIYWFTLLCLVLYNEYLVHLFHSWQWSQIECLTDRCVRILLVADAQILGNTFDTKLYWPLANYDSDRQLAITYRRALQHAAPDVICFLGDLMDEGSMATTDQYEEYFQRFSKIFIQPEARTSMIYIPGDNDIAGEGSELVKEDSVERFRRYFQGQSLWMLPQGTTFYNVNRISKLMPEKYGNSNGSELFSIVLSHISLLKQTDDYSIQTVKAIQPDVIFSAHDHNSKFAVIRQDELGKNSLFVALNTKRKNRHDIHSFNLIELRRNDQLLEISVPTCSYRMGVMKIGYGFAVLDGDTLQYTILWTSQRFYQLALYSLLIIPLKLVCGQIWCNLLKRYWCWRCRRNRNYLPLHSN